MTKDKLLSEYFFVTEHHKITSPSDAIPFFLKYAGKEQEHFAAITLNSAQAVIRTHLISIGTLDRTLVHPRDIFKNAIKDNAKAIIVGHNHPSGSLLPSMEDRALTNRISSVGELLGIPVMDSIIVSTTGYYSFLENDDLDPGQPHPSDFAMLMLKQALMALNTIENTQLPALDCSSYDLAAKLSKYIDEEDAKK